MSAEKCMLTDEQLQSLYKLAWVNRPVEGFIEEARAYLSASAAPAEGREAVDDVASLVDEWIRSRGTSMDGESYAAAVQLAAFIKTRAPTAPQAATTAGAVDEREAIPQVLKGIGKINGDGWKDTTRKGEVVFVWNAELPKPYKAGQYPRIGCEHWTASTEQYDFTSATVDEARAALATAPTMSEAARDTARLDWLMQRVCCDEIDGISIELGLTREQHFAEFRRQIDERIDRAAAKGRSDA